MKKDTHPTFFENAKITCACGVVYTVGSTAETLDVELCAKCHPFYTGEQKIIDTARRVEKFQTRMGKKATATTGKKVKRTKRAVQKTEKRAKEA